MGIRLRSRALAAVSRSRQGGRAPSRRHARKRPARRRGKGGMTRPVAPPSQAALALAAAGCGTTWFDSAKVEYSPRKAPPSSPARPDHARLVTTLSDTEGTRPVRRLFLRTTRAQRHTAARIERDLPEIDKVRLGPIPASERCWSCRSGPREGLAHGSRILAGLVSLKTEVQKPESWRPTGPEPRKDQTGSVRNLLGGLMDGAYSTGERRQVPHAPGAWRTAQHHRKST